MALAVAPDVVHGASRQVVSEYLDELHGRVEEACRQLSLVATLHPKTSTSELAR